MTTCFRAVVDEPDCSPGFVDQTWALAASSARFRQLLGQRNVTWHDQASIASDGLRRQHLCALAIALGAAE